MPLEAAPAAPAAPETTPAAPPAAAPEAGAPALPPRKTFDEVKAARRVTEPAAAPAAASAPATPASGAPAVAKTEIDMTPEELAAATAQSKEVRETRAKVKELEVPAAKLAQAQALVAEGKHLAAAELVGIDLNAAVAEQLSATPPGDDEDPTVKELREKVAKLTETEAQRATREAAELAARVAAGREQDVKAIVEHVRADAKTYPFLSRNADWVAEAYDGASDALPAVMAKIKADEGAERPLTGEEKSRLILAALAEKEAEHAKKAKLYGAPSVALERPGGAVPAPRPSARPPTFDASMRGGTAAPVSTPKTKRTFAEVKRARRASN